MSCKPNGTPDELCNDTTGISLEKNMTNSEAKNPNAIEIF